MSKDNLDFEPGYYTITDLIGSNVIEVDDTWFIKLDGVSDKESFKELRKWLEKGNVVRVIPLRRNKDARIVSEVWLGNSNINRQIPSYGLDEFRKAFKEWHNTDDKDSVNKDKKAVKFIRTLSKARYSINDQTLENYIDVWIWSHDSKRKKEGILNKFFLYHQYIKKKKMIKKFYKWEKKIDREFLKRVFSSEANEGAMRVYDKVVKNKMAREQIRAMTEAIDGKKIRNTSGV